jgi:hypothetical protein
MMLQPLMAPPTVSLMNTSPRTWTTEFSTIRGTPHAQFAPHVTGMLTSMLVDHFAFAPGWPFDGSGNSIAQTSLSDFSDQV